MDLLKRLYNTLLCIKQKHKEIYCIRMNEKPNIIQLFCSISANLLEKHGLRKV